MIQSDPHPKEEATIVSPNKNEPVVTKEAPAPVPKTTTFSSPPAPPQNGNAKKSIIFLLVILFIAAVAGGLIAFQNFSQTGTDLTQEEPTFAWRPYRIAATCTGVRVIGHAEQVPYSFKLTFVLSSGQRSGTLTHTFTSRPVEGGHKIDEDVTWASLGQEGATFGALLQANDLVNWEVEVNYTLNGSDKNERYADAFRIYECATTTSPSPSTTAIPSASVRASATASSTAMPSATATATARATSTATPTAVPTTSPAVGGPEQTPTPSPTPNVTASPTPAATSTTAPTNAPTTTTTTQSSTTSDTENREVAQAQSEELPKAGISHTLLFVIFGAISLTLAAVLAKTRQRFE